MLELPQASAAPPGSGRWVLEDPLWGLRSSLAAWGRPWISTGGSRTHFLSPCGDPFGLRDATGTPPRRSKTLPRRSQDAPKTLKDANTGPQEAPRGPNTPPSSILDDVSLIFHRFSIDFSQNFHRFSIGFSIF